MKNLVIVESPAKAKTIEKFLGKDYKVLSSYGHIRDLKKGDFAGDLTDNFEVVYEIPADKKHLVSTLKAEARKAETVWLASDEDREGEAIAWHLYNVLGLKEENTRRIVFHEITKPAILHAIENPRTIDLALVDAQQARRVLDRIVGFELSPVLWRKIKPALSAGRVQSVAVRLICEREKEIQQFKPQEYWRVAGQFATHAGATFRAALNKQIASQAEAEELLKACHTATFTVGQVQTKPVKRQPAPPFTTSTLQQEASRRLGFSVNQTMMLAQKLYEAGHITYMRTDSLNLSSLAVAAISKEIEAEYGVDYVQVRRYHTSSKGAQEAHEAIRPTYPDRTALTNVTAQEQRLYKLIRQRTLASQMADARLEKTNVDIVVAGRKEVFEASGEVVLFAGFMKAWAHEDTDEERSEGTLLPAMAQGDAVKAQSIAATERFTSAPQRYSEAMLVKKMEDLGIGRPSTYAPTISTIQQRDYVRKGQSDGNPRSYRIVTLMTDGALTVETASEKVGSERGKLLPTDVGMVVNDFLTEHFPNILDYNFTARVEEKFDHIASGTLPWKKEINEFYTGFHPDIERVSAERTDHKAGERRLGIDPESGKPVSVKIGRFGPVAQIGEASDNEKPRFASLRPDQSMSTITLEEALKLFALPRALGEIDGEPVQAAIGRFGPYVRMGKLYVSIPKDMSPNTITLEEATALITAKQQQEANKVIKDFSDEIEGVQVLNGRYGPYIAQKKAGARRATNYKIPKTTDPTTLTADDVRKLIEAQQKK